MENNFSQKFDNESHKQKSVINNFLVSFFAGILGAVLIIVLCFCIPSIKNNLFNSQSIVTKVTTEVPQVSLSDYSDTAINAAEKVLPSIVGISISYDVRTFGMIHTAEATGSGVIISKDGYILTNNHVVSSSDSSYYHQVSEANSIKVSVYNSDKTYDAKIIGTDKQTDLAIIKIEAEGLIPAELGDSSAVRVGEFVLAIGNPLGLETSVTSGIISALGRDIIGEDGTTYNVMQTDCAINSGNSGGALVNSLGQVIGINTLKLSGTGIEGVGFSIPINDTVTVYEQLINYGKVLRPYIGISGSNLSKATADRYNLPLGIYVEDIDKDGAAANSEIKKGDIITAIEGTQVKTMDELNDIKNTKKIGDTISITVYRSGEYIDLSITLTEMP